MIVRWYVLPRRDGFTVMREAKPHGYHAERQRALNAAVFMARVEADKKGNVGEVFAEDEHGRMIQQLVITPREMSEQALPLRQVGLDQVLVAV